MEQYGRMFSNLWKVRRVVWCLEEGWRRLMESGRKFLRVEGELSH
jgi:hypothetical protein